METQTNATRSRSRVARWLIAVPTILLALAGGAYLVLYPSAAQLDAIHNALDEGAFLLDVRSAREYAAGHLEGALNIPVGDLAQRLEEVPRGRPVVVY
ncbi:MAG: hypothetical protein ACI8QZ_001713 [Chlamydiales bacterium]|jgi:hypothetical protein